MNERLFICLRDVYKLPGERCNHKYLQWYKYRPWKIVHCVIPRAHGMNMVTKWINGYFLTSSHVLDFSLTLIYTQILDKWMLDCTVIFY